MVGLFRLLKHLSPLAVEANNLKSQSQQEGMWLEAQVNLYNMWTPIGKSGVKFFFQLISCLFTYWHICKQRVKIFFSPSSKKISKPYFEKNCTPLAGEENNLKSQSQQEEMWLEAQVNLYNM